MTQPLAPLRVLVIDDDAMSRELLGVLLEGEGYTVDSTDSGAAALALLARGGAAPDLVLADIQMPGATGSRLAGQLRRACPPATLLLAMSGSRPPRKTISRFDGFLLKPFGMKEVAVALAAPRRPSDPGVIGAKGNARSAPTASRSAAAPPTVASIYASAPPTASNSLMKESGEHPRSSPAMTSSSGDPVLDENIYQQLAGSMPAKQLHQLYKLCVGDVRKRIAFMRTLMAAHDAAHFVREAHAIKGGCGMLGATQLYGMAAELERNGPAAAVGAAPEVNSLDELSAACDRLERMLGSRV
jgi:CheY-like chemotaxis protein